MPLPASPDELSPTDWPTFLLERAPAMLAYVGTDMRLRYASPAYRTWMGIAEGDIEGRKLEELIPAELYPRIEPGVVAALNGTPVIADRELRREEMHRYAQASFSPDRDEHGRVRGAFVVLADISDRRALEARLKESERRFSQAFRHAAIGMALVLPDGRWLQVNDAMCGMLGYSESELLALSFQDITHPDDLATDMGLVHQVLSGERASYHMEKRYLHRDGQVVHALLTVSLVRDERGEPLYFVSQVQDISERKAFEDALFRERELAEVTLKSIGDAVITTDPDLLVTSLNPIAEAMTGWASHEAVGRPMDDIFQLRDPLTRRPIANPLLTAVQKNTIIGLTTDAILVHRNGFR